MGLHLPSPVETYFAMKGTPNLAQVEQCFSPAAVVHDEGRTVRGLAAIAAWCAQTHEKYHHTVETLATAERDGKIVVTGKVSGNFPGSPIDLDHIFQIEDDRIVALEIHP